VPAIEPPAATSTSDALTIPTTPATSEIEPPTPQTFVEAESPHRRNGALAITREVELSRRTSRPQRLTFSRTPKRHDRRGYRGQQSAADGSSDRAALAADQGTVGIRCRLHLLLLLRQADLQRAGVAIRLGGGPENSKIHLHSALGVLSDPVELALFGAGFISFPIVAAQILQIRSAGLYKHERGAFCPI